MNQPSGMTRDVPKWVHRAVPIILVLIIVILTYVVIGALPDTSSSSLKTHILIVISPFLIAILVLGALLFLDRSRLNQWDNKSARATKMLEQLVPELDPLPISRTRRSYALGRLLLWISVALVLMLHWMIVGAVLILLLSYSALVNAAFSLVIFVPIIIAYTLMRCWGMIQRYLAQNTKALDEKKLLPFLGQISYQFISVALTFGLFIGLFHLIEMVVHSSLITLVVVWIVFSLVYMPLAMLPLVIRLRRITRPFQNLDYDGALAHARQTRGGTLRLYETRILADLGETDRAQAVLVDILQAIRTQSYVVSPEIVFLDYAGNIALRAGRYGDAVRAYEVVQEQIPTDADTAALLAEAYLLSPAKPANALELTQTARQLKRKFRPIANRIDTHSAAEIHADHAWALAVNGQTDAARKSVTQALKNLNRLPPSQVAGTHLRIGYALRECGDPQANEHFRQAAQIDTRGWYGRMARAALAEG